MDSRQLFIQKAIQLSLENVRSAKGGPFAALIVRGNEIIATGTNQVTSINDPTAHAEIVAIREACKVLGTFQLHGCDIYTSCEPCPMCLGAIYWARPDKIFFSCTKQDAANAGFDDSFIYAELNRPFAERKIPLIHLPQDDALVAFQEWNQKKDKIRY